MRNEVNEKKRGSSKVLTVFYSYSGNTRQIAREIHKVVGGDIMEIEPSEPYPGSYNAVVERAKKEMHTGCWPELKTSRLDVMTYDTVFVGSPNWFHTLAPPVVTLLSESDLSGKSLIPFITHGGGGLGRSAQDIVKLCPQATVLQSMAVYGADIKAAQDWLAVHWPCVRNKP